MEKLFKQGRKNWLWLLLLFLSLFLLGNNLNQMKRVLVAIKREKEVAGEMSQLKKKNSQLKKRLSYIQTEDFIRKEAREKLGLGEGNETAYLLPPLPRLTPAPEKNSSEPNWRRWWRLFFY